MRRFLFAVAFATVAMTGRPKVRDHTGQTLIDMADVGEFCTDSYIGYAIVDNSLERCENLTSLQMEGSSVQEATAYEEYKCKHLRVHGEMRSGKCVCKGKYKGPICGKYVGCPDDMPSLFGGVCTKTGCANDGIMAIGKKQMECICKGQWDGKHCERLACWRLTDRGQDKRYRNVLETKTCACGTHYEGENCATLKSCEKNGVIEKGVCICSEGWGGETCGQKCPVGHVTCSTSSTFSFLLALPLLATVFYRFC